MLLDIEKINLNPFSGLYFEIVFFYRIMAPKYKLTYFGLKGLGESIRFMLSYIEADWEDNRMEKEQWASVKGSK